MKLNICLEDKILLIDVSDEDTIEDIIMNNNIFDINMNTFTAICKGFILNKYLSIGYQNIKENNIIIIKIKNYQNSWFNDYIYKKNLLLKHLNLDTDSYYIEAARIADLGFAQWEPTSKFSTILNEMYQENKNSEKIDDFTFISNTIINPASNIAEQPLPFCFIFDD